MTVEPSLPTDDSAVSREVIAEVEWDHHSIACGVLVVDAGGIIAEVNQAMAAMMGTPIDVAVGLRVDESGDWIGRFFYEDGSPISADELPIMRTLQTGRAVDGLVIGVLPVGEDDPRWTLLSVTPLTGPDGTLRGAVATVTEITAQKRAEALLARTAAELHGVIHALPDLFFHLDAEGFVVDYHTGDGFDVQVEPEALVGRRPAEFLPSEVRGDARRAYAEARLSGQTVVFEAASEVEGETSHYEFRYVALPAGEMVVIVRDVTSQRRAEEALRASEERYRSMFQRSLAGALVFDTEFVVTEVNDAFVAQTGMPREYFEGLDLLSLQDQRLLPTLRKALAGESGVYRGEYSPTGDDRGGTVVVWAQPLVDAGGTVTGGLGILVSFEPVAEAGAADS